MTEKQFYSETLISGDMKGTESAQLNVGNLAFYSHSSPDKSTGNEDSLGYCQIGDDAAVLILADGLGGYRAGGEASETAIKTLLRSLSNHRQANTLRATVLNGLEQANRDVMGVGGGAATTLICAVISKRRVRIYHIGDSGGLVVGQRGREKIRTIAHSPVGLAEASGLIDEEMALAHESRHLVSNVLGSQEMRIEIGPKIRMATYDTLLLASDGVLDNLRTAEITETIRKGSVAQVAQRLREKISGRMTAPVSGHPSKPDDLSFIVFRRNAP